MNLKLNSSSIKIGIETIPIMLERGKSGTVRISFTEENALLIETASGRIGKMDSEFLESKAIWILQSFIDKREEILRRAAFLNNIEKEVMILGKITPVEYNLSDETFFRFRKGKYFMIYAPKKYVGDHKKELVYYSLRKYAEHFLTRRMDYWAKECKIKFNSLRIKDHKSKWGSCSSLRNINLNWQLIFLEESLIDYIVIHELMHLREMNHGPKFWAWVAKYCPNYIKLRNKLEEKQWLVGILE